MNKKRRSRPAEQGKEVIKNRAGFIGPSIEWGYSRSFSPAFEVMYSRATSNASLSHNARFNIAGFGVQSRNQFSLHRRRGRVAKRVRNLQKTNGLQILFF